MTNKVSLIALVLFLVGCWGNSIDIYPDVYVPPDTGPQILDAEFYEGGGFGEDAIDEQFNVFVIDEISGETIQNAHVMVVTNTPAPIVKFIGQTDDTGFFMLIDENLSDSLTVHVLADGYVLETVTGITSSNITIPIKPTDPSLGDELSFVASGSVLGLDNLPESTDGQKRKILLYFGRPMNTLLSKSNVWFEPPTATPVIVSPDDDIDFEIPIPVNGQILYALAGIATIAPTGDAADDIYNMTMMGFVENINNDSALDIKNIKLNLNIALDGYVLTKSFVPPSLFNDQSVALGLDLGQNGTLWFQPAPQGSATGFKIPLADFLQLPKSKIMVMGRVGQKQNLEAETTIISQYPKSFYIERNTPETFLDYSAEEMGYNFSGFLSPPQNFSWDGEVLSSLPINGQTLGEIRFDSLSDGKSLWRISAIGDIKENISMPFFPADWQWKGVPSSGVVVKAWVAKLNADMSSIMFDNFCDEVRHLALNAAIFDEE